MSKHKCLSKRQIEACANSFLEENSPETVRIAMPINLEHIIENKLNINIQYLKLDDTNNLLGMTIMNPMYVKYFDENMQMQETLVDRNTILINSFLVEQKNQEHRYYFTLAHELGHWYLHRKDAYIDSQQQCIFELTTINSGRNRFVDDVNIFTHSRKKKLRSEEDWLEWQANYFASCILMPKKTFIQAYQSIDESVDKGAKLSEVFNVSKEAVSYRMAEIESELDNDNENLFNQME